MRRARGPSNEPRKGAGLFREGTAWGDRSVKSAANALERRVLFAAHSASLGGAELCLDTTLRHLDLARFQPVTVFAWEGPLAESARQMGIPVQVMPLAWWIYGERSLWYWKNLTLAAVLRIRRLVRLIRAQRIDLVYTNTAAVFEPALAARLADVPHLWHVHEVLERGSRMRQVLPMLWMQRFIRRYSSLVVFESESARAAFQATTELPNTAVVHNSLRFDPHQEGPPPLAAARAQFGLRPEDRVVGFVGQFIDRKNPLLLLEAMSQLEDVADVVCLFAGEGPLQETLQEMIAQRGLQPRCRLLPFQPDVRPLLAAVDVLVLPSRQESFGLVLIEAGAYGKPVVACRSQGPDEIVVDGETGMLVPQDDAGALARALRTLLESAELRQRMGAAGRQRVRECFHPETNTRRQESLMESLLAR